MWIGYCCEETDWPILHCLVCRLLGRAEESVDHDVALVRYSRGCTQVLALVPNELRRFYSCRSVAAVIGVDNDDYDPCHHMHESRGEPRNEGCPFCRLQQEAERTRERMVSVAGFVTKYEWPVIISVPVQAIEAWLLTARDLLGYPDGDRHAEQLGDRDAMKRRLYPAGAAVGSAVSEVALPLLRALPDVREIGNYSRSFRALVEQVDSLKIRIAACAAFHGEVLC